MKIIGIVAEFNPFHNGHKYFIQQIKEKYNPDVIILVLSSSFVQRGTPSILSKWDRAKLAVDNGINLVVELPFIYACQNAEYFSKGAIKILKSLGINYLAFGMEDCDLSVLKRVAKSTTIKSEKASSILKAYLNKGLSFIEARNLALVESGQISNDDLDFISKPNNILAIEYQRAIDFYDADIEMLPIERKLANHKDDFAVENFSSATFIRNQIDDINLIRSLVPNDTFEFLKIKNNENLQNLFTIFKYDILNDTSHIIKTTDYENGIENRIMKKLNLSKSYSELIDNSSNKRITKSRIRRMITNSLIRLDNKFTMHSFRESPYIRILAMDNIGIDYLSNLDLPKITNFKEVNNIQGIVKEIAEIEVRASNLYSIINNKKINMDYYIGPYIKWLVSTRD